jgi:hypothetical protein
MHNAYVTIFDAGVTFWEDFNNKSGKPGFITPEKF